VSFLSSEIALLQQACQELQLSVSLQQIEQLLHHANLIEKWNQRINLTAIKTRQSILTLHLMDALSVIPIMQRITTQIPNTQQSLRVLDVGSGGGFPGVAIAIMCPSLHVDLLDTVHKKTAFQQQVVAELGLTNCTPCNGRVEGFQSIPYDMIISRAFADLLDFYEGTQHLVHAQTHWLAMKGVYPTEELTKLDGKVSNLSATPIQLPSMMHDVLRHIVLFTPKIDADRQHIPTEVSA
jgi:16S rRNA (guanine527-N7)-methyltransferase